MSSIYELIKTKWQEAGNDITKPPHLMAKEDEARRLEDELCNRFKDPLKHYEDGLISATELLDKLINAASLPADE